MCASASDPTSAERAQTEPHQPPDASANTAAQRLQVDTHLSCVESKKPVMRPRRLAEVATSTTTPAPTMAPIEASIFHDAPTYHSIATTMAPMIMPVPRSCCSTTRLISSSETGTNGTSRCLGWSSSFCLRASRSAPHTMMASLASSDG